MSNGCVVRLAVGALLLAPACSGDSDGAPASTVDAPLDWREAPQLEQARQGFEGAVQRLDRARCEQLQRCRADLFEAVFVDFAACRVSGSAWHVVAGWAEGHARGNVQVNFERLELCFEDLARACDLAASEEVMGCFEASLVGSLGLGDRCLFDVECGPELYCDALDCDGVCRERRALGELCASDGECQSPLLCVGEGAAGEQDAGMSPGGSAGGGSSCKRAVLGLVSAPEPAQLGDGCGWLAPCASGLGCEAGVCIAELEVRVACVAAEAGGLFDFGASDGCGRGHYCADGVCAAFVTEEGASCADVRCTRGLECRGVGDGRVCARLLPWGEACERNAQCASDACLEGRCRQPWSASIAPSVFAGVESRCGVAVGEDG
ncbi:MAG: hypothetical protein OEZ06_15360 [Myxococcales bacterium]|nr:hypothetical protein [Myxococcales bacterium]